MPLHKRYLPGETHLYLGRQYRLRVKESEDKSVKLIGSFFYVMTPTPKQPQAIEDAMKLWYHSHAADIFGKRIEHCFTIAPSIRLHSNVAIRVRKMERRWGSCSQSGIITLNTDLVKTPIHCIDYVIMHELCHLSIHNHSPAFYRLLGRCMPDWKTRKDRLESMVIR
jgi:predicted metal-dependent hydrolase